MSKQPNNPNTTERKPGVIYETEDGQEIMHHYFPEPFVVFNPMRVTITKFTLILDLVPGERFEVSGDNVPMKTLPETNRSLESQLAIKNREN